MRALNRPVVAVALLLAFLALAVLAAADRSRVLLHADGPVSRWAVAHRTGGWTAFFRHATDLGSGWVVIPAGIFLVLAAALRQRVTAAYVAVVTALRPLVEWLAKLAVDRQRPRLAPLVTATGPSFPSGHVMGAVALWALVPVVLSLYVRSRLLRCAAVVVCWAIVAVVAASRVYLGVHWSSDVVGGFLCAVLLLIALRWMFRRLEAPMSP